MNFLYIFASCVLAASLCVQAQPITTSNMQTNLGMGAYSGLKIRSAAYNTYELCPIQSFYGCGTYTNGRTIVIPWNSQTLNYFINNVIVVALQDPSSTTSVFAMGWAQTAGLSVLSVPAASISTLQLLTTTQCSQPALSADQFSSGDLLVQCFGGPTYSAALYPIPPGGTSFNPLNTNTHTLCGGGPTVVTINLVSATLTLCATGLINFFANSATAAVAGFSNIKWITPCITCTSGNAYCNQPALYPCDAFYILSGGNIARITYTLDIVHGAAYQMLNFFPSVPSLLPASCTSIIHVGYDNVAVNCNSSIIITNSPVDTYYNPTGINSIVTIMTQLNTGCQSFAGGIGAMAFDIFSYALLVACQNPGGVLTYSLATTQISFALSPTACPTATSVSATGGTVVAVCNGNTLITANYNATYAFATSISLKPSAISWQSNTKSATIYTNPGNNLTTVQLIS